MCGIAGVRAADPITDAAGLAASLDRGLAHRGPDGHGVFIEEQRRVCLVHRRLAIIDPTRAGHQPMWTPDGRHAIVFNGEIYNHHELRSSLEREGEHFATASDTEVLLRLVARRGTPALADVRGMFAFAIWDAHERTLTVARDRFGIKPLYWSATGGRVVFASEVGALVRAGLVARRPSPAGVLAYLRWASIPAPLTWVAGVHALVPGTWRRWDREGREAHGRFADVRHAWVAGEDTVEDADALAHAVQDALVDAVRAHLVADVPVGVFVSGGLDSAALVKACRAAGSSPVRAFTVVTDDPRSSEGEPAAAIARAYGAEHQLLRIDAARVLEHWPRILRHLDQPSADGVNTFAVAGAVAGTGIKCVLSGVGGDELLGGYPSFARMPLAATVTRGAPSLATRAGGLAAWLAPRRQRTRWRHAARSRGRLPDLYRALRGFYMPEELAAMVGPALRDVPEAAGEVDALEADLMAPVGDERPAASVARLETCGYLRQQLLRDVDVMSMAHGLEVRTPFVDHELLARIWPAIGGHPALLRDKQMLRRWLAPDLPHAVVRKPKQGFLLPFGHWIDGPLHDLVRGGLADLATAGWVAPAVPGTVWRQWRAGHTHWSRPWGLAVLGRMVCDD